MRARGPDLLAVDDPVVALLLGARAQPGNIGTSGGLREQLAPDLFAGGELRQIVAFVFFTAKGHHGRAAHAFADLERLRQLAVDAFLLLPDHLLDRRRATPAIFLRPVQAGPAGFGFLLLPGLADIHDFGLLQPDPAERGFGKLRLEFLRCVGADPLAGLGAERGFLRGIIEIHGGFLFLSFRGARSANPESRSITSGFPVCPLPAHPGMTIRYALPLVGILLNGTSLSTRISPGRPSTRSAMMLRMISSVPPSTRVPGARSSIAWNFPASSASGPLKAPAAPCRSSAKVATSCTIDPATNFPMEFSGPGRSPFDKAEIVRMLVY